MELAPVEVAVVQRWTCDSASLADVSDAGNSPCAGPIYLDGVGASTVVSGIRVLQPCWMRSAARPVLSDRKELVAWSRALSAALASQKGKVELNLKNGRS